MTDVLTPQDVVRQLTSLARDLDAAVRVLKDADRDAVLKRHAADIAESRAYVRADGSVELRKHVARLACEKEEEEALVAEALVRHLRKQIDAIQTRIDVGRSYGAAVRAELKTLSYSESP